MKRTRTKEEFTVSDEEVTVSEEEVVYCEISQRALKKYLIQLPNGIKSLHAFAGLNNNQIVDLSLQKLTQGTAKKFSGADLGRVNISWMNLTGTVFEGTDFSHAIVEGITAEWTNFSYAIFKGANLEGSELEGAEFECADLERTNLTQAGLNQANFANANLSWANLTDTDTTGANFRGTIMIETTGLSKQQLADAVQKGAITTIAALLEVINNKALTADQRYKCAKVALQYAAVTQDQGLKKNCLDTADNYIKEINKLPSKKQPGAYRYDRENTELSFDKTNLLFMAHQSDKGSPLHIDATPNDVLKVVTHTFWQTQDITVMSFWRNKIRAEQQTVNKGCGVGAPE